MLSKSKGQVLRVAADLHVLFVDPSTLPTITSQISMNAIIAAQNFVDTCCQHAAFIAGRGLVDEEIQHLVSGHLSYVLCTLNLGTLVVHTVFDSNLVLFRSNHISLLGNTVSTVSKSGSVAAYCLLLPGKVLNLSALLQAKKFRGKGNKEGAVAAMEELHKAGLGKLISADSRRGASSVSIILISLSYWANDTC